MTLAGTAARRVLQGPVTGSTNQRRPGAQASAPTVSRFHFTHTAGRLSVCLSHAALCEPFVSHPPVPFFLCYFSPGSLFPATGLVFDTHGAPLSPGLNLQVRPTSSHYYNLALFGITRAQLCTPHTYMLAHQVQGFHATEPIFITVAYKG